MDSDKNFLFGINPILEKLRAAPNDILEIIIANGSGREALRSVDALARRLSLPVIYAAPRVLDRLSEGKKHQGVLARVDRYPYLSSSDLIQRFSLSSGAEWILIVDGLTDPRNFGALLRSAEAVGVRHIVIPKDRCVGVTPTVVKASSGAVFYLNVYRVTNLRRAIEILKEHGFWIVGLNARADEGIHVRLHPPRLGIVVGSEGAGIRPLIQRQCDYLVSIPMLGRIGSLNVAVAGAVFFYELLRQKRSVDKVKAKG